MCFPRLKSSDLGPPGIDAGGFGGSGVPQGIRGVPSAAYLALNRRVCLYPGVPRKGLIGPTGAQDPQGPMASFINLHGCDIRGPKPYLVWCGCHPKPCKLMWFGAETTALAQGRLSANQAGPRPGLTPFYARSGFENARGRSGAPFEGWLAPPAGSGAVAEPDREGEGSQGQSQEPGLQSDQTSHNAAHTGELF